MHTYFLTTYIGKPKENIIENYKTERLKKHPIWATHLCTHLSLSTPLASALKNIKGTDHDFASQENPFSFLETRKYTYISKQIKHPHNFAEIMKKIRGFGKSHA